MSDKKQCAVFVAAHRFRLAGRWIEQGEKIELVPAAAAGPLSQGLIVADAPVKKLIKKTDGEI